MKNPSPNFLKTGFSRKNAPVFKSGISALLLLLVVLSCKTGGGDPSPDRVEATCLLKAENAVSATSGSATGFGTTYEYDNQGRLTVELRKSSSLNNTTATRTKKYAYDTNGFLTSVVTIYDYGAGSQYNRTRTKKFEYANGRLVRDEETGPQELTSVTDKQTQEYEYDAKGDLIKKTYKITSSIGGSSETVTTYANGQVTGMKDSRGNTYELNSKGLVTKTAGPAGTEFNEYNAKGELIKTEVLNPDGSKLYANTYEHVSANFTEPTPASSFKGFPTEPSSRGKIGPIAKQENFFVSKSGTYDKDDSIVNTYQLDGQGNVVTKTETHTMPGQTMTYVRNYEYDGCK